MMKPWLRNLLITIISLCILIFIFIFFYSDNIFYNYFDKYIESFNKKYDAGLLVKKRTFSFPNHVELSGISLVSKGDTILKVNSLDFNVKLFSILKRDPSPSNLNAENIYLKIIHKIFFY